MSATPNRGGVPAPSQPHTNIELSEPTARAALRLLVAYANSDVPDSVSLECAQVCGVLRAKLNQEAPK